MFKPAMNYCSKNIHPCALCGAPDADHHGLCADCHGDLPWLVRACPRCALPLEPHATTTCNHCRHAPPPFDRALAAFHYDFPLSQLLPHIKYQRQPAHIGWLGRVLAAYLRVHYEDDWPDALIPVPMHPLNELHRGFNQASLLAEVLAKQLQLPIEPVLRKRQRTPHQMSLNLEDRRHNLHNAFDVARPPARHVALIDDVMTTGTTVSTLTTLLKRAGAERVDIWVLARTPEVR